MEMVQLKLRVGMHQEVFKFRVSVLRKTDIFLGHDWLKLHNPSIDWWKNSLRMINCPGHCHHAGDGHDTVDNEGGGEESSRHEWEGDRLLAVVKDEGEGMEVRAYMMMATKIAIENQGAKRDVSEIIPRHYMEH